MVCCSLSDYKQPQTIRIPPWCFTVGRDLNCKTNVMKKVICFFVTSPNKQSITVVMLLHFPVPFSFYFLHLCTCFLFFVKWDTVHILEVCVLLCGWIKLCDTQLQNSGGILRRKYYIHTGYAIRWNQYTQVLFSGLWHIGTQKRLVHYTRLPSFKCSTAGDSSPQKCSCVWI